MKDISWGLQRVTDSFPGRRFHSEIERCVCKGVGFVSDSVLYAATERETLCFHFLFIMGMREQAKKLLAPAARFLTRRLGRVLMYHRFGPDQAKGRLGVVELEEHVRYLRRYFYIVPLRQIVERIRAGSSMDPHAVAVTVDDAYSDFGEYAYPIFRKYGVPITLYVVSEFATGKFWLWWDAIRYLIDHAGVGRYRWCGGVNLADISLTDAMSRQRAWCTLAGIGVMMGPRERDRYLEELQQSFGMSLPASPPADFAALNWSDLRAMDPEIVEIGAHSCSHPILSRCTPERIVEEVAGSKKTIEAAIGRPVTAFCYPNGEPADVDERCVRAVRDAGFESAVMACGGMVSLRSNPYTLERMPASHKPSDFRSDVSGIAFLRSSILARKIW